MERGIFVSFEGSEGCGKSTQIGLLAERLEAEGVRVVVTREPGGTALGEEIRRLLKFAPQGAGMAPEAELLLFAASRAQLVRELVVPSLAAGAAVLADRFLDSTTAYQGVGRRLDAGAVALINAFAVGNCMPDRTFLLDLDGETARARMLRRPRPVGVAEDRMEAMPAEFYERVRRAYLDLAREEPGRVRVIDGSRAPAEVAAEVWAEVKQLMGEARGVPRNVRA